MAKTAEIIENVVEFEMAEKPVSFLDGEYFTGMCELAAAAHTKTPLFVDASNNGLFESLYHKRTFGRSQNADGSWNIGNFNISENRYLYEYDRNTRTYGAKKETNMNAFLDKVKKIIASNEYTVFSTTAPVKTSNDLASLLAL